MTPCVHKEEDQKEEDGRGFKRRDMENV